MKTIKRKTAVVVFTVCCVLMLSALRAAAETAPEYRKTVDELNSRIGQYSVQMGKWKYREKCDEKCFEVNIPENVKWKSAAPGFYWKDAFQVFWFRREYEIPKEVAGRSIEGSKIILTMNVSDGGDAYADGVKKGGVENGTVLVDSAEPGKNVVIGVRVHNGTWPGAYMGANLTFSVFDEITSKTKEYSDRVSSAEVLINLAADKGKWVSVLNDSAAKIDMDAMAKFDEQVYFKSLESATAALDGLEGLFKEYSLYMLSYSHIDLAWLWDYAEGEIVTRDTLKTIFELMNEYPDWKYAHSQAHGIKWMEDDYPEIFAELKKRFNEGRIEIVGGTWSEHDSNIPGGEGFARQFLYGKRYFREKFGKDIVVAWTPDSFGYNWNLPQFLVKSGMKGFLTQKLGSNEVTRFPHTVFWWEGADGSRVLTYFPPSGYAGSVDRTSIVGQLGSIQQKHGLKENFVIYGVGDHGGGLTRGHLDRAFTLKNEKAAPKVTFSTAENYFQRLLDESKKIEFPVWGDELYLEHHRGTYTTQSNNKKNNRRTEQLLTDAEKIAVLSAKISGAEYPKKKLFDTGWYYVLLNHMHDILPGSGIRKVYEDSDKDYAKVYETANGVIDGSLENISGKVNTECAAGDTNCAGALMVFNTLAWKRDAVVEVPLDNLDGVIEVLDPVEGIAPPFSQIVEKDGKKQLVFIAKNLPPMGYAIFHLEKGLSAKSNYFTYVTAGDDFLENEFVKVTFDKAAGKISSVFDKKLNREFLKKEKGGGVIQAFKDTQNAWEIQADEPIAFDPEVKFEIVESGLVRATVKITRKILTSTFEHYISLYANDPMVYGRLDVDYRDHNMTTKLAFDLDLLSEDAWFEIPYAAISRKTMPKTAAEKAKYEVSGHTWVDYTNTDGSAGLSLLNRSKYGFDVKENVLRMTLLRSPVTPDPEADMGKHSIEYALYTHAGDWRQADTPRRAHEYNFIPHILATGNHSGDLPPVHSFASVEPENVELTAMKPAEDGGGIILRLVETEGRAATAKVTLPWAPAQAVETNLIEDEMPEAAKPEISGATLTVPLGKYEIKTIKISE